MKPSLLAALVCALSACLFVAAAPAAPLAVPSPDALSARLKAETVTVVEPHLTMGTSTTQRRYVGYPARALLDQLLGKGWISTDTEIEFRALDGFVSRVPSERFARYKAWLVFGHADGSPFRIDKRDVQEQGVSLAPFYLVWDNIGHAELLKEGSSLWPYQVAQVQLTPSSRSRLLPAGLRGDFRAEAALAQQYCISCHQINGYGGDKMPFNLAERARALDAQRWQDWLLRPRSLKPETLMPGLPESLPADEREAIARKLYDYLRALPLR